jgi:branched-chain amino acid transport system substrate-binding protein
MLLGAIFLVLVLGALPLLGACAPEEVAPPPPEEEAKTLKLSATLPLGSPLGIGAKKFYDLVVAELNEAGGLVVKGQRYKIEMIIYDDKYTAEGGRAAVERLVFQDNVKYIFQLGSAPTLGGLTVTEPNKVLVISAASTAKLLAPEVRYAVRGSATGTGMPRGWAGPLEIYPNLKTVVTLAPDDETGRALTSQVKYCVEAAGLTVLATLYYPRDIVDWTPVGTKIASLNPDFLEVTVGSVGGADEGLMMQAAYNAGWRGITKGHLSDMKAIREVCSDEAMEGAIGEWADTEIPNPPQIAKEFKKAWIDKYGTWEGGVEGIGYGCPWNVFLAAVKKADSLEVDDILTAMEGLEFDTPQGRGAMIKRPDLGCNKFADCVYETALKVVRSGECIVVGRVTVEDCIKTLEMFYGYPGEWR